MPSATASPAATLTERIRYPFRARHVQLLARERISPGFLRLTVGGPQLEGFVSQGFGDHCKVILPEAGRDRARLPVMRDERPQFDDNAPPPVMRDYTPLHYDPARQTLTLDFALHEGDDPGGSGSAGPATHWASHAPIGQWLGLAGPRGSLLIEKNLDWHWLLGDETAMPALERRLAELPTSSRAVVRVQLHNMADRRDWRSRAQLDCAWVPSLLQAAQALEVPASGSGFVWAAGEGGDMAALRRLLLAKGVSPRHMRVIAYWKRGLADHHGEIRGD